MLSPTHAGTTAGGAPMAPVSGLAVVGYDGPLALTHPVDPVASGPVWITLTLTPNDYAGLNAFDAAVIDPTNPAYHHFLTEAQFVEEYAPTPGEVASLHSYFGTYGASSWTATPDGLGVSFEISSQNAESALHTLLLPSPTPSGQLALSAPPRLPASLAADVLSVGHVLSGSSIPRSGAAAAVPGFASSRSVPDFVTDNGTQLLVGSDYTQLFGDSQLFPGAGTTNASFATNEAVATILWSGENASGEALQAPFNPAFVNDYFNGTFPSGWPVPVVQGVPTTFADITPPVPGPLTGPDPSGVEGEAYLDLEMAGSMAPGATLVTFYGPGFDVLVSDPDMEATSLSQALSHNYEGKKLAAVSNSFGLTETNDTLWNTELLHAASMGVTVFASTGDTGDAPLGVTCHSNSASFNPEWPSDVAFSNYGVVAVGGTTVTATGVATTNVGYDSNVGALASQSAWYESCGQGVFTGSTGGISSVFAEPSWQSSSSAQSAIVNDSQFEAGYREGSGPVANAPLGRGVPDISLPGNNTIINVQDPSTGAEGLEIVGGTSVASPMAAGMFAEMSAVAGHSFGFVDPEIYRIGSYFTANPGSTNPLLDVSQGGNFLFKATKGWDAVTGWGDMNAPNFVAADANPSIANYGSTAGSSTSGLSSLGAIIALIVIVLVVVVVVAVLLMRRGRTPRQAPTGPMGGPSPGGYAPTPPGSQNYPYYSGGPPPGAGGYPGAPPAPSPPPPNPTYPTPSYASPTPPPSPPPAAAPVAPPPPRPAPPTPAPSMATSPPAPAPSSPQMVACPRCGQARPWGPMSCPSCGSP